jgi:hypothetical protein
MPRPECVCYYLVLPREYWMIYRGPGFLAIEWFGSSPVPLPLLQSASCLSFSVFLYVAGRAYWRERRGSCGRGAKSYAREKTLPSMYYSILSGFIPLCTNVWAPEMDLDTVFSKGKFFHIKFPSLKIEYSIATHLQYIWNVICRCAFYSYLST